MSRRPRTRLRGAFPLAALRSRAGVSQQSVAERMGWRQSGVSRIEHGDPTLATLLRYLRALPGTTTLTVSGNHAQVEWTPPDSAAPAEVLEIDLTALDEDA